MPVPEIRIANKDRDVVGEDALHEAKRTLGIESLDKIKAVKIYRVEGPTTEQQQQLIDKLFCEPINEKSSLDSSLLNDAKYVVEIAYKPGVMNPESASILKSANDLGIENATAADSSYEYGFYGAVGKEDVDMIVNNLLMNKTVQYVVEKKPETLVIGGETAKTKIVEIKNTSDNQLMELSKDKLFLNLEEMKVIKGYFNELGRNPTDCELEIIAARWSEHCGHKTFAALVEKDGELKKPLFQRIKETSKKYFGDFVVSAFEDNSGVVKFYDGMALTIKIETHNSPSAIEPYGGAATGTGGVLRDILGTGQGAALIASMDMFCFAPPDTDPEKIPVGCLNPDYLQRQVVAGVRDYGNRMGVPTNNGSVYYHPDFGPKPSVIVGACGIIPEDRAQKGKPKVGDLVIAVGGKTGRDGIHGATFSSGEMTDKTISVNSTAVQIGNAIEEKRMSDAIIEAREKNFITAITDCGAAGFSSAIGEMGEDVGVTVDIKKAPLKYPGLTPWEIFLSESQERMVMAVDPKNLEEIWKIFEKWNVEATVLGEFDGTNKLTVKYGEETVADLDYDFLKNGLPQRIMKAKWEKPCFDEAEPESPTDWKDVFRKIMSNGNVASKEPIVRQYDHGVQGTSALSPFGGVNYDGPNDGTVLTPIYGKPYGMVLAHGLNPLLTRIDPYEGSKWAIAEALANYVAAGGNPKEAGLVENFIWPFPDEQSMGSLDMSVDAIVDSMNALKIPVISGKDSLSSTYRGKIKEKKLVESEEVEIEKDVVIKIPEVLCISVVGRIPDVEKTTSSDLKKHGSTLCLVGKLSPEMGGSTYFSNNQIVGNETPKIDLKTLPKVLSSVHEAIQTGEVLACHDISHGGVAGAIAEMAIGGDMGVELDINPNTRPDYFLFNETAGTFIVEVENEETAKKLFGEIPHTILGKTKENKEFSVIVNGNDLFTESIEELEKAFKEPLRRIFA